MKITIDEIEVLELPAAAKELKVTLRTLYNFLNDNSLGLVVKRNNHRRYVTKESVEALKVERNKRGL